MIVRGRRRRNVGLESGLWRGFSPRWRRLLFFPSAAHGRRAARTRSQPAIIGELRAPTRFVRRKSKRARKRVVPHGNPGIPHGNPGIPHGNPGIPHGNPGIPHGNPGIPHGNPGIRHGNSGEAAAGPSG